VVPQRDRVVGELGPDPRRLQDAPLYMDQP